MLCCLQCAEWKSEGEHAEVSQNIFENTNFFALISITILCVMKKITLILVSLCLNFIYLNAQLQFLEKPISGWSSFEGGTLEILNIDGGMNDILKGGMCEFRVAIHDTNFVFNEVDVNTYNCGFNVYFGSAKVADLNNNGFDDIVTLDDYSGVGGMTSGIHYNIFNGFGYNVNQLRPGFRLFDLQDFDGDGLTDIVYFGGDLIWHKNLGGYNFQLDTIVYPFVNLGSTYGDLIVEDFNNDGFMDILVGEYVENILYLYQNVNNTTFITDTIRYNTSNPISIFNAADVDQDGSIDIGIIAGDSILCFKNQGGFNFLKTTSAVVPGLSSYMNKFTFDDLDSDSDLDLLFNGSDSTYVYINDGGMLFNHFVTFESFLYDVGDLDLDGDNDIIFYNQALKVLENVSSASQLYLFDLVSFIDYDQNGIQDAGEPFFENYTVSLPSLGVFQTAFNDTFSYAYLDSGTYDLAILLDTSLWFPSDSLSRTITFNSISVDTIITIGVSPVNDLLFSSSVSGSWPRCGDTINHTISYQNIGGFADSVLVKYTLDSSSSFISSIPLPDFILGQEVYFSREDVFPSELVQISIQVELTDSLDSLINTLELFADTGQFLLVDSSFLLEEIRCSYDPNDKQVFPSYGDQLFVLAENELEYLIRFQNTGNDTAFYVEILDTLSDNLVLESFRIVAYSHQVEAQIDMASRELSFVFNDIVLTDTATSIAESEGFIRFAISPVPQIVIGDSIENTAHIIFDSNTPIITNTVISRIYDCSLFANDLLLPEDTLDLNGSASATINEDFINSVTWSIDGQNVSNSQIGFTLNPIDVGMLSVLIEMENELCEFDTIWNVFVNDTTINSINDFGKMDFRVYPNPANDYVRISTSLKVEQIDVFNLLGELVSVEYKTQFSTKDWESGMYLLKLKTNEGFANFKLLKQ